MARFFALTILSYYYGPEYEPYEIGIFRTREEAEQTAQRYLRELPGFRDYECEYHIHEIEPNFSDDITHIHGFEGWNEDADGTVLESITGLFADREQAEAAMEAAKAEHPRQHWTLDSIQIGACDWAEGFERVYPEGFSPAPLAVIRDTIARRIASESECGFEFLYSDEPVNGYPLALGEKLFLMRNSGLVPHYYSIRLLRDTCSIGTPCRLEQLLKDPVMAPLPDLLADLELFAENKVEIIPNKQDIIAETVIKLPDLPEDDPSGDLIVWREDSPSFQEPFTAPHNMFRDYDAVSPDPDRIAPNPPKCPEIDLTSWRSVFESLSYGYRRIEVSQDYDGSSSCYGYIEAVEEDRIRMKPYRDPFADPLPFGTASEPESVTVEYKNITSVEFNL